MTSKDVKFSIDQARAAAQGWGYIDTAIKSVTDPTPTTVVVSLKFPWAPLLADRSLFANDIVPYNYGGKSEAAFYQAPVGTGPFKWDYWHKGQALKLVKNTYYWQPGKPYLDSVTWTDVASDNTRQLQLKGGQAQIDEFPAWSSVAALKSTPSVDMNLFNSTRTDYMAFNEKGAPFNDVHVRRAISLAIDREAMIKAVLFGNGQPANSFMPPQVPYYQKATAGREVAARLSLISTSLLGSAPWSPPPLTVEVTAQSDTVPSAFTLPVIDRRPSVAGDHGSPVAELVPVG